MRLFCGKNFEFTYSYILLLLLLSFVKSDREHIEHGFSAKFKTEHGAEGDQHNVHADHKAFIGVFVHKFRRSFSSSVNFKYMM